MKNIPVIILLILAGISQQMCAQNTPPFWDDVQTIRKYDKMYEPPANPVLFIGSSSIRKWDNAERVFADYQVLNRGIGGAVINDITFYLNDLVFPYNPRQIVIYVGDNDLTKEGINEDSILHRTQRLIYAIRARLPDVPIAYISIKPSPSREKYLEKVIAANTLIKNFLGSVHNTVYIDVFHEMLDPRQKPRPELFVKDMLHMNPDGYEIWRKAVLPELIKK